MARSVTYRMSGLVLVLALGAARSSLAECPKDANGKCLTSVEPMVKPRSKVPKTGGSPASSGGGQTAGAAGEQTGSGEEVSFAGQVYPVLVQSGCSSCHAPGTGHSFVIEPGSSPGGTYASAAALGCTVKSALLTKPTGAEPHVGPKDWAPDGPQANLVRQWLLGGCQQ